MAIFVPVTQAKDLKLRDVHEMIEAGIWIRAW